MPLRLSAGAEIWQACALAAAMAEAGEGWRAGRLFAAGRRLTSVRARLGLADARSFRRRASRRDDIRGGRLQGVDMTCSLW